MKIIEVLQNAIQELNNNKISDPIMKSRILLANILKVTKEYLVINSEQEISIETINKFNEGINKLIKGEPLQYITQHQEFMRLDFYVDENVLIPRQDTEILVEEVINSCDKNKDYKILDLCTGSGAIGVSLAKYIQNSYLTCTDISSIALEIAKKNAKENNIENIEFIQSDMFENINKKFDIIVSNPPYIAKSVIKTLDKEVQKEPSIALDGGIDGLDFYKIIANNAHTYLQKNGLIFLEIGYDQKEEVSNILETARKYTDIYSKKDLYDNDRIVVATKI